MSGVAAGRERRRLLELKHNQVSESVLPAAALSSGQSAFTWRQNVAQGSATQHVKLPG